MSEEMPNPLELLQQILPPLPPLPPLPFQQLGLSTGAVPDPIELVQNILPPMGRVGNTIVSSNNSRFGAVSSLDEEVEVF